MSNVCSKVVAQREPALLVESQRTSQVVLSIFLDLLGYQTACAATAVDALALARTQAFCLLLVDVGSPDAEGWTLLRELQTQGCLPSVRVSMSAHLGPNDRQRSRMEGCQAHLVKPFQLQDIQQALRRRLRASASWHPD